MTAAIIGWLAIRRFNYIDTFAIIFAVRLAREERWAAAVVVFIVGLFFSAYVEGLHAWNSRHKKPKA